MIYFNFVVTDEEAESIFDAISDEINFCIDASMSPGNDKEWYIERAQYLKELKSKMRNEVL